MLAKAELLAELGQLSSPMGPTPSLSRRPADVLRTTQSLKFKCWKLRESFEFSYGEQDLGILPFWAHFSAVMVSTFHTLLFMTPICMFGLVMIVVWLPKVVHNNNYSD